MNTDVKVPNKILADQIQEHDNVIHQQQLGPTLTYANE